MSDDAVKTATGHGPLQMGWATTSITMDRPVNLK